MVSIVNLTIILFIFIILVSSVPTNVSPTRLAQLVLRASSTYNQEGRPWSLLLTAYHIIMVNCMGIAAILALILEKNNLTDFVQIISTLIIYIHNNVKCINLLSHQNEIQQLLKRIDQIRTELLDDVNTSHFIKRADTLAKKCILTFNCWFLSFPIFSLIINFINDYQTNFIKPHLVVQVWTPLDMRKFLQYLIGAIFVCMNAISILIYYTSFSSIEFTFAIEVSAFLKELQYRLKTNGAKDKTIYRQHARLIGLIKQYNEIFSGQIYIEILLSSLQPCGFGYAFIKIARFDAEALDLLYKGTMCLAAPIVICACGQEISSQVGKLHEYSFMGNWYEEKPAIRKDLLTMMTVTVKPVALNYRRMTSFDYVCLATVGQGIYSYLMMIVNLASK